MKKLESISNILTSKWALRVVRELQSETKRFGEIQKSLSVPSQKVLTETLRRLERNGMVDRKVYPTIPPQVEYKLTPIGLDLLKLSNILSAWIDTHADEIIHAQKSYDRRNKA